MASLRLEKIQRDDDESAREMGARIRKALDDARLVHVVGVELSADPLREFYEGVADAIGRPLSLGEDSTSGDPTGERWISINFDPDIPDRYRHARVAQPLHTDYAYTADNPELALMYCARRAPRGGATLFVDAEDVVRQLARQDPELLNELRTRNLRFSKAGRGKVDRVVSSDGEGTLLTWLYTCVDPGQDEQARAMARRFSEFVEDAVSRSGDVLVLPLDAGDAVIWHDRRLLHGREAYEARESDDRLLWKTGIYLSAA